MSISTQYNTPAHTDKPKNLSSLKHCTEEKCDTIKDMPEDSWTIINISYGADDLISYQKSAFRGIVQKGINNTDRVNFVQRIYYDKEYSSAKATDYVVTSSKKSPIPGDNKTEDPFVGKYHCEFLPGGAVREKQSIRSKKDLKQFIENGIEKFPAKHYCIIFDGHATGLKAMRDVVHGAMKSVVNETLDNNKFDILFWQSCTMNRASVAKEFSDVADIQVGSQDLCKAGKWPTKYYISMLEKNRNEANKNPFKIAKKMVGTNRQPTASAIDLGKMELLEKKVNNLGEHILEIKDKKDLSKLKKIIRESQHFYRKFEEDQSKAQVDLYDFAERLSKDSYFCKKDKKLTELASDLLETKKEVVIAERYQDNHFGGEQHGKFYLEDSGAKGLSFFLSTYGYQSEEDLYRGDLQFIDNTNWKKVNQHIAGKGKWAGRML